MIVAKAASQLGNTGGKIYWSWYGFGSRVPWCGCFVSWCANECGYIASGTIPKFSLTSEGVKWFQNHGKWKSRSATPAPGDLIFFDWNADGGSDHVGIVESVTKGMIQTIEGNSSNCCKRLTYAAGSGKILGYGTPSY